MTLKSTIIIATHNKGKLKEFQECFREFDIDVRSLADYPDLPEIIEDGATFADNALLKAKVIAEHLQLPVLADDSGLCVDALGGRPGVYSARYAGEPANDQRNNEKLLAELKVVDQRNNEKMLEKHKAVDQLNSEIEARSDFLSKAQFVCVLVLYNPANGETIQVEGVCPGYITANPRGEHGFGYDPLFVVPQYNQTMAELSPEIKNQISHRGDAIRKLLQNARFISLSN